MPQEQGTETKEQTQDRQKRKKPNTQNATKLVQQEINNDATRKALKRNYKTKKSKHMKGVNT